MSEKRLRARAKRVQKLGRDGLVEQNLATGEEKRVSQRTADISFGPDRAVEQMAGHRAAQRGGGGPAAPSGKDKKRRKQPRPVRQTAEEAAYATPESADIPDAPVPDAPSMRMAADAPLLAPAVTSEDTPPPMPAVRKRRNRRNRKKIKRRQTAKQSKNVVQPPENRPAPMRGAGDAPMQNRPPGKTQRAPAKHRPRLSADGGRLKFEAAGDEKKPALDGKKAAEVRTSMKKRQVRRFASETAQTQETEPSAIRASGDTPLLREQPPTEKELPAQNPPRRKEKPGHLRFEGESEKSAPILDDADAKRAIKKQQVMDHAADTARSENRVQLEDRTLSEQPAATDAEADTHQRDSPQPERKAPELSSVPDDRAAYKKWQAEKFADHSASPIFSERRRLQFKDKPPPQAGGFPPPPPGTDTPKEDTPPPSRKYDKAVLRVERAEEWVEQARDNLPTKRRLSFQPETDSETSKPRRRLHFEQEVLPEYRKPSLPVRAGGMVKTAAVMKLHGKIRETEQDNVAVEATHKSELFAEQGVGRALRWSRNRRRSKPYRALRQAERKAVQAKTNLAWQTALRDNPELRSKNALMKWMQKQKIKRKYAQAAHEAKQTAQFTQNVVNATGQVIRAAAQYAAARKSLLALIAMLALVIVFFSAGLTSCTAMISGTQSSYISTVYLSDEQEICNADLYFTEMETDLQMDINGTAANYPGYDEYRYSIGEISHDPYELMSYLSAAHEIFTFDSIRDELEQLFAEKYQLTRTVVMEGGRRILQTNLTVRRMEEIILARLTPGEQTDRYNVYQQTLGNRQAYGNPFDFPWLASVSSGYGYRIHPITGEKNLHRGVDIAVAEGTPIKAIHDGRVISAGDAGGYGLCVVIEDEHGYQSRYAHCSSLSVSAGQEVHRGDVIAAVGSTGSSTGPHLHLEVMLNGEYLNPYYFVETGGMGAALPGTPGGPIIPDDPGVPMGAGPYAAVLEEAERWLGMPYVWGGSSPSTSFDCSGYVSWVLNQSGAASVGRQTVLGLENLCTPVSSANAQPGDLIFFINTYDAPLPGPTHVGIYVGNGQFIHCGSSGVSYASVSSSYWTQHFYGYGRIS